MEMLFTDCINDHANYILMFMIKLIQHVNNSSQCIDACAHGNSAYLVVIQPQSLQQQSMRYIYTNRWLSLYWWSDLKIQGFSTYGLGAASTLPYIPNQRWWSYDTDGWGSQLDAVVERQRRPVGCRGQLCEAIRVPSVCHPCGNFYYNTWSFLPSLYIPFQG